MHVVLEKYMVIQSDVGDEYGGSRMFNRQTHCKRSLTTVPHTAGTPMRAVFDVAARSIARPKPLLTLSSQWP